LLKNIKYHIFPYLLISYSYHFYKIESLFSSHIILRIVFRKITGCTLSKLINTNLLNPNNLFASIDFQTKFLSKINLNHFFNAVLQRYKAETKPAKRRK